MDAEHGAKMKLQLTSMKANTLRKVLDCGKPLPLFVCWLLLAVVVTTGCTTKSKAKAQSAAAYNAGRAQAYQQALESQRTGIRVIGNVRNHDIEWREKLSLMEALVIAEWTNSHDPREIIIIRKHQPTPVNMKAFLEGEDVLLEPGDTIEIQP
jgi:hypothetical protein